MRQRNLVYEFWCHIRRHLAQLKSTEKSVQVVTCRFAFLPPWPYAFRSTFVLGHRGCGVCVTRLCFSFEAYGTLLNSSGFHTHSAFMKNFFALIFLLASFSAFAQPAKDELA